MKHGVWTEVGTRVFKSGGEPVKFIELSVTRLSDTVWPLAGSVAPNYSTGANQTRRMRLSSTW